MEKELLSGILAEFFRYNKYKEAIRLLKLELQNNHIYIENWAKIKYCIETRALKPEEPLNLIHISANLVLDENSDDEAYKWLDLLIKNIDADISMVEEY